MAVNNVERYSRQMLFPPIGEKGQQKLLNKSALVVGVGALGTSILDLLVRSGIGKIVIVDRDYVELSNLQRQSLFTEEDVQKVKPKAIAAKEQLSRINSSVKIEAYVEHVSKNNIEKFISNIDIIFDGTDNFQTRYLLNDIAFKYQIPFVYGGVVSSRGMSALFIPNKTPCLRCLLKDQAQGGETCDTVGVIAPAVNIVTALQVTEALKYLTDNDDDLKHTMISFDIWKQQFTKIKLTKPYQDCKTCQLKLYPTLMDGDEAEELVLCGRNTIQIQANKPFDLEEWEDKLKKVTKVTLTPFLLRAKVTNEVTLVLFSDGRVLVQGTEDIGLARSYFDRYIGS